MWRGKEGKRRTSSLSLEEEEEENKEEQEEKKKNSLLTEVDDAFEVLLPDDPVDHVDQVDARHVPGLLDRPEGVPAARGQRREALGGELLGVAADPGIAEPRVGGERGVVAGPGADVAADGEGHRGGRGGEEEAGPGKE